MYLHCSADTSKYQNLQREDVPMFTFGTTAKSSGSLSSSSRSAEVIFKFPVSAAAFSRSRRLVRLCRSQLRFQPVRLYCLIVSLELCAVFSPPAHLSSLSPMLVLDSVCPSAILKAARPLSCVK